MTATMTPPRPPETRSGKDGFVQVLHSEWTKFRTVRSWVVGILAAAVVMVLVGLIGTGASNRSGDGTVAAVPTGPNGQGVNDSFLFVHQTLTGDGSITVPITSLTGEVAAGPKEQPGVVAWSKAGLIVKDGLTQGSTYAAIMATGGHGVRMQYDYIHDTAGLAGVVAPQSPRWLRLVRAGDTISGYNSADGSNWSLVGTARLSGLSSTAQVGLFVTSPQAEDDSGPAPAFSPAVATAAFGRATLAGGWTQGSWKGEQVGGQGNAGTSGSYSDKMSGGFTPTAAGGFTVTGAGDIAPIVGGPAMGPGYTIENFLVGAFAGLIVVIVLGTLLITSEYRFGMIRTTLAASPRRGRVLIAKALVLGSVAFVAGLVASFIAVTVGQPRARNNGFSVMPVSSATEARVVVGTGLLLALASVLALAVGTLLRRSAAAVTIVIAAMILPYILATASILPTGASNWMLRVTPAAGFAIQQSLLRYDQVSTIYAPSSGYYPLSPWAGFAVLAAYTAVALGAAVILLRRRDA